MSHSVNAHLPRLSVPPILSFLLTLSGCGGGEPAAQTDLPQATPVVMAHKQAQALDHSLKGDVIWVNADSCGSLGASVASRLVQSGMRQEFLVMLQRDRADGVAG